MTAPLLPQVTAFEGTRCIASGSLISVAEKIRAISIHGDMPPVLIFDDQTGARIDLNLAAPMDAIQGISTPLEESESRNPGRPKLGVIAREVTLMPRHWDWLAKQQGGASAALRRLIDQARRQSTDEEKVRAAREALYRFMTAMVGDAPGYEEALRALFAGDAHRFSALTSPWATDVRRHIWKLAPVAFGMAPSPLDAFMPISKRESALRAFGTSEIESVEPITNGASGAGVFKVIADRVGYILRIEGPSDGFRDPARQYACWKIAAEAGVAPRLIYADANAGVAVAEFIAAAPALAERSKDESLQMIVKAVRKLHEAPRFPGLVDYLEGVDMLIRRCMETGILPKRVLEKHLTFYGELAAAYPGKNTDLVSSHNDLNPGNVLFQKDRVLLVDWESAFAADRYVDLAALANFFTTEESQKELVLQSYFGTALSDVHRARFFLMQQANRMFYAMVVLNFLAAAQPGIRLTTADMKVVSWSDVRKEMDQFNASEIKTRFAFAMLNEVLQAFQSDQFQKALALVRGGGRRRGA
jgi:thiamine kinase-like enzyme